MALWSLGYPDQALHKSREGLALAQELSHPYSLALAHLLVADFHSRNRDPQAVLEQEEAAVTLATEHGFAWVLAAGTIYRGWALVAQGRESEGIAQLRQGIAAYQAAGALVGLSGSLSMLADGCGRISEIEEGLAVLTEALRLVDKTEDRSWEPELHRLKGELTMRSAVESPESGALNEAEERFQRAIAIARHQQAKSLELRAAMSLSRLWQRQGKREEALELLGETYDWFTEGFDTADLKEAKALLKELSA
jgi:predicted ATPase